MELRVQSSPVVSVTVTSSATPLTSEKRFNRDLTIGALKSKLEMVTGALAADMRLEAYTADDKFVCAMTDNNALLGSFPVDNGMRIHVVDERGGSAEFTDVSKVQKYEMSDEVYAQKKDSVRAFKARMKVGQFAEGAEEEARRREGEERLKAEGIHAGDRCEVRVAGQPVRRGTVRYVGETGFKPGQWVGVQYDEPHGKHDGMVEGRRYFECAPKYGAFVRPNQVTVGNFPELGLDDDDMEM